MEQSSCRRDRREEHQGSSGEPFRHPSLPGALSAFHQEWCPTAVDRKSRQGELPKFRPLTFLEVKKDREVSAVSRVCRRAVPDQE